MRRPRIIKKHCKCWAFDLDGEIKVRITKTRWLRRLVAVEIWTPIPVTSCGGGQTAHKYHLIKTDR